MFSIDSVTEGIDSGRLCGPSRKRNLMLKVLSCWVLARLPANIFTALKISSPKNIALVNDSMLILSMLTALCKFSGMFRRLRPRVRVRKERLRDGA